MTTKKKHTKPASPRESVNGADVARLSGLSRQRVSVLLRQGKSAGEIILEQELKRAAAKQEQDSASEQDAARTESFIAARGRKESILADLRALDLRRRNGELVEFATVNAYIRGMIVKARNEFLLLPNQLRDRLGAYDALACGELLDREIRRILGQLATFGGES